MQIVTLSIMIATVAAIILAGALAWGSRPAQATPAYAQQTNLGCPACHVMPPTATSLTPRGKKFKDNGGKP